jgi:LPS-assembly lipoprotein
MAGALVLSVLLPLLAGCGFTPLYGTENGSAGPGAALGEVTVALIPDRNGQMLRQDLQERLERSGGGLSSHYDLSVALSIYGGDIAIDQFSASTRSRQTGNASWTLRAQDAAHTVLASGSAHALDGYDIVNQQFFAADMSREQAAGRIDESLADQIVQQLAVYFRQHPPA